MERLLSSTRLLAVLLLLLLLADSALAWRVPVSAPSPPAAQARHPRGSSPGPLQAAVYSTPSGLPPSDGSSVPLGPVATPSGYKFVPYDGEEISKLAVRQWWRVLARLSEVALPITNWYALVRSDEVRSIDLDVDRIDGGYMCMTEGANK